MIEILPGPDHVVAIRVAGTVAGDDYDRLIAEIEARLQRHERIGLYADLTGFEDVTTAAIGKDISYSLGKLGEWKRFPRNAVVTDKQWLRILVRTVDSFLPHIDAKAFASTERDQARAWVAAVSAS